MSWLPDRHAHLSAADDDEEVLVLIYNLDFIDTRDKRHGEFKDSVMVKGHCGWLEVGGTARGEPGLLDELLQIWLSPVGSTDCFQLPVSCDHILLPELSFLEDPAISGPWPEPKFRCVSDFAY